METFNYAQLDAENFCVGISSLSGEVIQYDMIQIETYDTSYLGRKYDREKCDWTDEYRPKPDPEEESESHENKIRDDVMREIIQKGIGLEISHIGNECDTKLGEIVRILAENGISTKVYFYKQNMGGKCDGNMD